VTLTNTNLLQKCLFSLEKQGITNTLALPIDKMLESNAIVAIPVGTGPNKEKHMQKLQYLEEKSQKLPCLDNEFLEVARTKQDSIDFLLNSWLTSNQIWLIPLLDDCRSTYLTKLNQKRKENEESKYDVHKTMENLQDDQIPY
jgi:hypothetical protein